MAKQLHLTSAGVWFKLDGFPGDYRIFCSQLLNRAWFRRCPSSCVQLQHSEEAFGDFCGFITSHFLPCKRCSAPGADIPLPGSFLGRALFVSHDCRLSAEGAQAPSAVAGSREANIRTSALRVVPASPQAGTFRPGNEGVNCGACGEQGRGCGVTAQLQRWLLHSFPQPNTAKRRH